MPEAEVRFIVPGRPPNLANGRMHWARKASLVRERKELVWGCIMQLRPGARPAAEGPRSARATAYLSGTPMDPDNLMAALKCDLDAMGTARKGVLRPGPKAGVLVDDTPAFLSLEVRQVACPHRNQQRVEWELRDRPA